MNAKYLFGIVLSAMVACTKTAELPHAPQAEYETANLILMYTPGEELFDGTIHPNAALFENYFNMDEAAKEHENYITMLRNNDIEVKTVRDILLQAPHETLVQLAEKYLKYDISDTSLDSLGNANYKNRILAGMSQQDLIRILLRHPQIQLHETDINTGLFAQYIHEPLMNMYFMRDQSINTPAGTILCRMNSPQRYPEVDIVELCYRQLGMEPVYRIHGVNSYLEGGDYIPFGTMGLLGQGLRTTQDAIDEMLNNDVIGHDTLVVVRDHWKDQYQMHLDTYFNIIDWDLATMCFNRYDAVDTTDIQFLTIDMYAREPGTKPYHPVAEYAGYSFKQFLQDRGVHVIRVSQQDANHYANNYLTIEARHIMSVANQSDELKAEYAKHNVHVEWVPLENLIQGYGAAHCMTQVILRH